MTTKRFGLILTTAIIAALCSVGLWQNPQPVGAQGVSPVAQFRYRVASKSSGFTADTVASEYNCDVSSASFTATLPAAAGRAGLPLTFKVTTGGTGKLLTIDGNSSETIDGSATRTLYEANDYLSIVSDGTNWKVIAEGQRSREKLSANRTYYVATTGSDSNSGLASGSEFLTIQKAIDVTAALDLSIYNVTINVADGTYTGQIVLKSCVGAGQVYLTGNVSTPGNVLISVTSNHAVLAEGVSTIYTLDGMKLQTTTSGFNILASGAPTKIYLKKVHHGAAAGGLHIYSGPNVNIYLQDSYTITNGTGYHWYVASGGSIDAIASITITLSGTPAFSSQFAFCGTLSQMYVGGITFSGSATGTRYLVNENSVLRTGGGGASYLPGDAAGSTATGGVYN